jgi:hypothetical protein
MYIVIYSPHILTCSEPVAIFDLTKKRFTLNLLGLGVGGNLSTDLAHHVCHGYKASVSNLAKLPRNTRGTIEAKAIPTRLPTESLQAALAAALKPRGRKAGEPAKPLRGGLTAENRHQRPKVVTDGVLQRASVLRAEGHTWKTVAASLGVGFEALKKATQRASTVVAVA